MNLSSVLSLGQTLHLHCRQFVTSPVSGTISYCWTRWVDLDQIHHLIFFGTIAGPLLLASSSAYTVEVWWDCTLRLRVLLVPSPSATHLSCLEVQPCSCCFLSHAGGNKSQGSEAATHRKANHRKGRLLVTVERTVEHWVVITKSMAAFQKCHGKPLQLCISTKQITTLKSF